MARWTWWFVVSALSKRFISFTSTIYFAAGNYIVTIYTGNKYLAGTDSRVFVELFGQTGTTGEVEMAGSKNAFERSRLVLSTAFL